MTNCPVCGSELKTIPAGVSKKTGKPYQSFTACPNKCKTSWNNPSPQPQNSPTTKDSGTSGDMLILEEIQSLRKEFKDRMTNLAQYLQSKLG